jgi:hypothetical protein
VTPVQVTIFDAVSRGLVYYFFGLRLILGKLAADEEGLELEDPIHSLLPCQRQEDAITQRWSAVQSPLLCWRRQGRWRLESHCRWRSRWLEEALLEDTDRLRQAMRGALGDFICIHIFPSGYVL